MTKSDKKHELASPSDGLRALRDRLEATGAPVSAVRIRNAQRTTILVLDASLSMAGSETEVRRGARLRGSGPGNAHRAGGPTACRCRR